MAEQNPYTPGTPEWQEWLNDRIAEHDAQAGNEPRNDPGQSDEDE
jgi:hypothetical protein